MTEPRMLAYCDGGPYDGRTYPLRPEQAETGAHLVFNMTGALRTEIAVYTFTGDTTDTPDGPARVARHAGPGTPVAP